MTRESPFRSAVRTDCAKAPERSTDANPSQSQCPRRSSQQQGVAILTERRQKPDVGPFAEHF
jgi:hypothetical protein